MATLKLTEICFRTYKIEKLLFSPLNIKNEFYYASLENSPKLVTLLGDGRPFFSTLAWNFCLRFFVCIFFFVLMKLLKEFFLVNFF